MWYCGKGKKGGCLAIALSDAGILTNSVRTSWDFDAEALRLQAPDEIAKRKKREEKEQKRKEEQAKNREEKRRAGKKETRYRLLVRSTKVSEVYVISFSLDAHLIKNKVPLRWV